MSEPGINYYEMFPEIRPEMSPQAIRQALEKNPAMHRHDAKSLEIQAQIEAAREVFRDEASKQEYDRKLAESRQEPPKNDPRQKQREDLENLKKRAQDYLDNGENDLAKIAIKRALDLDTDHSDSKLYALAARIYDKNEDHEAALKCINEAIFLEPEEIRHMLSKAEIYFNKAEAIAKGSSFQSSPQLQEEYRSVRARGLKLLGDIPSKCTDTPEDALAAEALGIQAYELYFHPDKTDEEKAAQEKIAGLYQARDANHIFPNENAQTVLNTESSQRNEQNKWTRLAKEHRDKKEYTQARSAIEQALSVNVVERSEYLYSLAASIYYNDGSDYDTALKYINKALELKPDNIHYIVLKGLIYGHKARQVARNSQFRSSTELKKEYRRLRDLELAALKEADAKSYAALDRDAIDTLRVGTYAMGKLAYALYFRSDELDAEKARKEKILGLDRARIAHEILPDESGEACKVLRAEDAEIARGWAEAQEQQAKQERNQRERDTLVKQAEEYFNRGNYNQAGNAVLRALELDVPDRSDDYYLYRLAALSYFNSGEDKNTALNYADKALKLKPDDVSALVLKGLIYSRRALRTQPSSQRWEFQMSALQNFGLARAAAKEAYTREDNSANRKQYAYALGHVAYALYFGDSFVVEKRRREFPTKDQKWLFKGTGKTGLDKLLEKKEKKRSKDLVTPGIEDALLAEKIAPGASKEASEVLRDCKARGLLSFWD